MTPSVSVTDPRQSSTPRRELTLPSHARGQRRRPSKSSRAGQPRAKERDTSCRPPQGALPWRWRREGAEVREGAAAPYVVHGGRHRGQLFSGSGYGTKETTSRPTLQVAIKETRVCLAHQSDSIELEKKYLHESQSKMKIETIIITGRIRFEVHYVSR